VLSIDSARRWEKLRIIKASYCHIDSPRLLVTFPRQHGSARATELANHSRRRSVFGWLAESEFEPICRNEEPCNGLRSGRTSTIGTVAHEYLVRTANASIANGTTSTASNELIVFHMSIVRQLREVASPSCFDPVQSKGDHS
jgi:hypothetical protein